MRITTNTTIVNNSHAKPEPKPEPKSDVVQTTTPDSKLEPSGELNSVVTLPEVSIDMSTESASIPQNEVEMAPASADAEAPAAVPSRPPTKISTAFEQGVAFLKNVAPDIVDNMVIGETPVIPLAVELIQWIESNLLMKQLTGLEKKRIVINLLLWLVDNQKEVLNNVLGENEDEVRNIVKFVLPSTIDAIIAATKGKVLVNQFAKQASTWCCCW